MSSYPLQCSVSNSDGTLLFLVVKSTILAFKQQKGEFEQAGRWTDTLFETDSQQDGVKKLKSNKGEAVKKADSPAVGSAFSLQIRNLTLTPDESKLIACADSDKSVLVFEIDYNNPECLKLVKRQPFPKRPNAIAIGDDGDTIAIADKFGDVHQMSISGQVLASGEESQPILGHVSMLTDIIMAKDSAGHRFVITSDRDEHIKISHYPQCFIVDKWLFGHKQFISSMCCPSWNSSLLFSAGGDDSIYAWDWKKGTQLSQFNYSGLIKPYLTNAHLAAERFQNDEKDVIEYAVSKVVSSSNAHCVAFFVEATKCIVLLDVCPETGSLTLMEIIEFPSNVVSLSEANDEFIVTLDTHSSGNGRLVEFVTREADTGLFKVNIPKCQTFEKALAAALKNENQVGSNATDLYPLYNTISLKKHGEHYS
ncbi:hypothetical protein HG536_0C01010 [Torulaspora globosa]|uniref:Uncharacterized protein n=1 Tax=Torulaspora globosa TaxID=48254 RepID=A0A7G3ZEJ8_9SACH|nr:uncharacterized protein HG536_0C01010 [Torulaspora globosa]QLL31934.1 hypothetical protein HG536_0C01010 [Torulaspora globosa]